MAAQRPRPSVLSLFDPLSSRSYPSPDSDKENDSSETSFFHLPGFRKQIYSPMHKLRRRLIDVGDVTVDEPDIRDLLEDEEELEAEIKQSVAIDEDENATLTFRDMAKAATPKWSARRNGHREAISTPRTPLAEIVHKDDETPTIGRKKMLRRQVVPSASEVAQVDSSSENNFASPLRNLVNLSTMVNSPPKIEIYCDERKTNTSISCSSESAQRTFPTLEQATPIGTLINASSIPVFVFPSSSSPSTSNISPQSMESRLHPNAQLNVSNRLSVDLHASFQLHLQSSETTFDLLNDKISFFGSTSGPDASLEERDSFFDDGEDFGTSKSESIVIHNRQEMVAVQESDLSETKVSDQDQAVEEPRILEVESDFINMQDQSTSLPEERGVPETIHQVVESVLQSPVVLVCETGRKNLSTPSTSRSAILHPPRPVPALKIVKRTKASDQQKVGPTSIPASDSRRSSIVIGVMPPRLRAGRRQSGEDVSPIMTSNDVEKGEHTRATTRVVAKPNGSQSGDGPRRVPLSDGPKILMAAKAQSQVKPVPSTSFPRRIPASVEASSRSTVKQPAKNATVGSAVASVSSIPKPVSRNAGSRIPAPSSFRQRFGVQTEAGGPSKGSLGRRT